MRWRALLSKRFTRGVSTEQWSEEMRTIRSLRKHERIIQASLKAECDETLHHIDHFNQRARSLIDSVEPSLRQSQYVCTERLDLATTLNRSAPRTVEILKELQAHCDDLQEIPYPEWQPGDQDIITRQVQDPELTRERVELEADAKHKDLIDNLQSLRSHLEEAEEIAKVFAKQGRSAGRARTRELLAGEEQVKLSPPPVVDIDSTAFD